MKTLNFTIDKALVAGQHTESIGARNRDVLQTLKNMRPTEYGAAFNKPINTSIPSVPSTNWPYPNLFKGRGVTILADDQAIYEMDESDLSLSALTVYKASSANNPSTESVTDGDFSSAANWTLNSGWSISGGVLTGSSVSSGATALQPNVNQASPIAANKLYQVTYTINSITSGSVYVNVGGAAGTSRTQAGTYTEELYTSAASTIFFNTLSNFSGEIDNLSVKIIEEATIPAGGGAWHFAEFKGIWFLFKEGCVITKVPYLAGYRPVAIIDSIDDFTCNTGENFNNRLFLGGITADTLLATTDWEDAWRTWVQNSHDWSDEVTHEDIELGPNTVMYSTRVGGDAYSPFIFELALLGFPYLSDSDTVAALKANYIDWIKKGEIGFVPLPHQGAVQRLKRLGNRVIAYCTDGVSAITPREDRGFRVQEVHSTGIASRSAVSGDNTGHLFLDTNNILWEIGPDGSKNRVCGAGTFNDMVSNESTNPIVSSYDPEEGEHYICSDQEGYIRTRTGIGEITILPTSLIVNGSGLVGVVEDLGDGDLELLTETFDMGLRSLKTVHTIAIGFTDIANLSLSLDYKYDSSTTWRTSRTYAVNNENVTVPIVTANDFRIRLTGTPGPNAKIDYIGVEFQVDDKRNIRSVY